MDGTKKLLFENKQINPIVSNYINNKNRPEIIKTFRTKFENDNKTNKYKKSMDDFSVTNSAKNIRSMSEIILNDKMNSYDQNNRLIRMISTPIFIDSRDRDLSLYPRPNNYKIHLGKIFSNVKRVSIKGCEIPNTEQLIRDFPASRTNNKIYWTNEDDLSSYIATIPPGNYQPEALQTNIQIAMNNIKRSDGTNHNFTVIVDTVANVVSFSSLVVTQIPNSFSATAGSTLIIVNHPNHGILTSHALVNISNSIINGIDETLLNGRHLITVIDPNHYSFDINSVIPFAVENKGGKNIFVGIGKNFSLLWSNTDSIGNLLGFPQEDTEFSTIISNTKIKNTYAIEKVVHVDSLTSAIVLVEPPNGTLNPSDYVYLTGIVGTANDILFNDPGGFVSSNITDDEAVNAGLSNDEKLRSFKVPVITTFSLSGVGGLVTTRTITRSLKLAGENYMFLTSPELGYAENTGQVKDIFAKIQLTTAPGNIIFNTGAGYSKEYINPLPSLSEITFTFKTVDNHLYDFVDSDHSLTLEIVEEIHEILNGIQISSRNGTRDQS